MTFTPFCLIVLYYTVAFLFIIFGATVTIGSSQIVETERLRYDNNEQCIVPEADQDDLTPMVTCSPSLKILKDMRQPSYFYYSLTDFYQNARKYVKSRSSDQLQGKYPAKDLQNCEPILKNPIAIGGNIIPCGLTARSKFNDTFRLCHDDECSKPVKVRTTGIAWSSDKNEKFRPGSAPAYTNDINELLQDEDFMVWMRLSAFKDFEKLYAIVAEDLKADSELFVKINASFPVASFDGSKSVYIATTKWFGARNYFLGTTLLVFGFLSLFLATGFLLQNKRHPRNPSEENLEKIRAELARLHVDVDAQMDATGP